MFIPEGFTEARVLDAIAQVCRVLAPSFPYAYHGLDDVYQDIHLLSLEALASGRYDPSKPLENFLYTHCRNRLLNKQRKELSRYDPPCRPCHAGTPCRAEGPCDRYRGWAERNAAKGRLLKAVGLEGLPDECQPNAESGDSAELFEIYRLIDEHLPVALRCSYLRMRAGESVPKGRRNAVIQEIRKILLSDVASLRQEGGEARG